MNNMSQFHLASRAIPAFFTMNEAQLTCLARDLDLRLNATELLFCKNYFERVLHRAPFVAELYFIAEYLSDRKASPLSQVPHDLTFEDPEIAAAFADMMRKHESISKHHATHADLETLANTAARYLARAGREPRTQGFFTVDEHELALLYTQKAPRAVLMSENRLAVLTDRAESEAADTSMILLATTLTADECTPKELAGIVSRTAGLGAKPLCYIGNEGLLHHLAEFGTGIELFPPLFPHCDTESAFCALSVMLKQTAIIALPAAAVSPLLALGAPLKPIGKLLPTNEIIIRYPNVTVSLTCDLLTQLHILAHQHYRATVARLNDSPFEIKRTQTDTEFLCCTTVTGSAATALLTLLREAFAAGTNGEELCLSLSLSCNRDSMAKAIGWVSECYRFLAELALPAFPCRIISSSEPQLTLALAAPRREQPGEAEIASFDDAVSRRDYAKLRALLYQI